MTEGKAEGTETSVARSVWNGRAAILSTSFVFAAAAFLALLLVGPRYEATVVLAFDDRGERGSLRPAVLAQAQSRAFSGDVAARLPSHPEPGGLQALSRQVVGIVEGRRDAPDKGGRFDASHLSVLPGHRPGEYRVSAVGASPDEAQTLADAAAAELAERVRPSLRRSTNAVDPAVLAESRRVVEALELRLATDANDPAEEELIERQRVLSDARREARAALRRNETRAKALGELTLDPLGAADLELVSDPELRVALAAYRSLSESIDSLERTLPDDSPRTRIARLRLTQLQAELAPVLGAATVQNRSERAELTRRIDALDDEAEALEREIAAARLRADARAATQRELDAARERYRTLSEAVPEPVQTQISMTSEPPQRTRPPFWPATAFAALAGLVVGTFGSAASALISRRERSRRRSDAALAVFDKRSDDEALPDEEAPTSESVFGVAGEAPAVRHDSMTMAEAVSAVLSSRISRTLIVAGDSAGHRSGSLALARTLAESGRLVLLVDLSPSQNAVREAGVPTDTMGLSEVTAHMLGLSSVTVADEKSALDLVTAGTMPGEPAGRARAEALGYAARAYDHVIVDCGLMPASEIAALADKASAILLEAPVQPSSVVVERLRTLDAAGLDTALLTA